jgi:predicted ester cyclase
MSVGPGQTTSSIADGKALVRRYLEDVFSGGNLAAMDEYLAGEKFKQGVAELVSRWRTAFSDFHIVVDDVIAEADRVVTVEIMSGTHDGVYQSRIGPIAPTGRKVSWSRIAIRFMKDGRFTDGFWEEDDVGLLQQLGALTDPTAESDPHHRDRALGGIGEQVEPR